MKNEASIRFGSILARLTVAFAIISIMNMPISEAQTIPPENHTVTIGNTVISLHYADVLCSVVKPPDGAVWPAKVSRTMHVGSVADIYTIYKPDVRHPATLYRQIPIAASDRVVVYACGCVQTGGSGKTWKSYFNPKGDGANHLYSGTFGIIYSGDVVPSGFWNKPTGMQRIKDAVTNQGPGFMAPPGRTMSIVLGYEDDGYSDNGYTAHDDGTGDQCKGVGPAAVDIILYHSGAR